MPAAGTTRTRTTRTKALAAVQQQPQPLSAPTPTPSTTTRAAGRSRAGWIVMIGVPILLGLTFVWQLASGFIHTDPVFRGAVAVGRVSLEADPAGSRVDFVLVDRVGQEATMNGSVNLKLREPDGTLWQTSRTITSADFQTLPDGGLLAGRSGYSVVIPASDWARAPRRGGSATVSISVQPAGDGSPFSTVAEERFP